MTHMIQETATELVQEAGQVYKKNGTLTDEILTGLQFIFGAPLLPALDLVEKGRVSCLISTSGRSLYQVIGTSGAPYVCMPDVNYCTCPAYKYAVIKRGEHLTCKHVLAIRLSVAMDLVKTEYISNEELTAAIVEMGSVMTC